MSRLLEVDTSCLVCIRTNNKIKPVQDGPFRGGSRMGKAKGPPC